MYFSHALCGFVSIIPNYDVFTDKRESHRCCNFSNFYLLLFFSHVCVLICLSCVCTFLQSIKESLHLFGT